MAYIERRRGLHALPADVLLAPGTDNLEIGKGITRACMPHRFTLPKSLLSHSLSPKEVFGVLRTHKGNTSRCTSYALLIRNLGDNTTL
jgi:hypothetical protein